MRKTGKGNKENKGKTQNEEKRKKLKKLFFLPHTPHLLLRRLLLALKRNQKKIEKRKER